jgi:Spy/CpxP family protein refolding chaperone
MSKGLVILTLAFIVTFAAGVTGGLVVHGSAPPPAHRSWLSDELNLRPDQQAKMREIWEPSDRQHMGQSFEEMRAIRETRDKAIRELLTEEQRARYDEIVKEASQKMDAIGAERRKGLEEKITRTREILDPAQRQKFDALQSQFMPGGPPFGGGPGRGHRRPPDGHPTMERGGPDGGQATQVD